MKVRSKTLSSSLLLLIILCIILPITFSTVTPITKAQHNQIPKTSAPLESNEEQQQQQQQNESGVIEYLPPVSVSETRKLFNFASLDAGAKILASNNEAKKTSRILTEDKDKYMLIPRSAKKKYVVIELSEEIMMHSIALANYEYYSCSVKHFQVLGSTQYPCPAKSCYWHVLGAFKADSTRQVQTFMLKKPKMVRYLKILFLTHYGTEHFCTLSLVRVHGTTLIEDAKAEIAKPSSKEIKRNVTAAAAEEEAKAPPKEVEGTNNSFEEMLKMVHNIARDTDELLSEDIKGYIGDLNVLDSQLIDKLLQETNVAKLEPEKSNQNITKPTVESKPVAALSVPPAPTQPSAKSDVPEAPIPTQQPPTQEEAPKPTPQPSAQITTEPTPIPVVVEENSTPPNSTSISIAADLMANLIYTIKYQQHANFSSIQDQLHTEDASEEQAEESEVQVHTTDASSPTEDSNSTLERPTETASNQSVTEPEPSQKNDTVASIPEKQPKQEQDEKTEGTEALLEQVPKGENIFKILHNRIRKQEVQQAIFRQHLQKINLAFKDVEKVLHKNAEEHNVMANVIYKFGDQLSQIQQDNNKLWNMYRTCHRRNEEMQRQLEDFERLISDSKADQLKQIGSVRNEIMIFVSGLAIVTVLIITACIHGGIAPTTVIHTTNTVSHPKEKKSSYHSGDESAPPSTQPVYHAEDVLHLRSPTPERRLSVAMPTTPSRDKTPRRPLTPVELKPDTETVHSQPKQQEPKDEKPKEKKKPKLNINPVRPTVSIMTPSKSESQKSKSEVPLGNLMQSVHHNGSEAGTTATAETTKPQILTDELTSPSSAAKMSLLGHIMNYVSKPSHMYETETEVSDAEDIEMIASASREMISPTSDISTASNTTVEPAPSPLRRMHTAPNSSLQRAIKKPAPVELPESEQEAYEEDNSESDNSPQRIAKRVTSAKWT